MTLDEAKALVASVPYWHQSFEVFPGLVSPGAYNPDFVLAKMQLNEDLGGLRVLDIGPSDGFYALQARKRGAEVVCVDYRDRSRTGFAVMERLSGYDFDYRQLNVYDLPAANLGGFDVIFFLGVLYHLPDMVRALSIVRALSRGTVYLETHCENDFCSTVAAARYYADDMLNNDWTNFWAPNRLCVLDMLYDSGFEAIREEGWGTRLLVEMKTVSDPAREKKLKTAYGKRA